MRGSGNAALTVSGGLFAVFLANVLSGASGRAVFLSDVAEMLTLFAACIFFVVAVLRRERAALIAIHRNEASTGGNPDDRQDRSD